MQQGKQCHCVYTLLVCLSVHLEGIMQIMHLGRSGHLAINRQCLCHGQARSACEHANFQHCLGPCQSDQGLQKRPLQCASTALLLLVELCLFLQLPMQPVRCSMMVQYACLQAETGICNDLWGVALEGALCQHRLQCVGSREACSEPNTVDKHAHA